MYRILIRAIAALFIGNQAEAQTTSGQIFACVNNSSGTIHAPDAGCANNEITMIWTSGLKK
jgi:hypothetical protein